MDPIILDDELMNCFYDTVDQRNAFSLISSRDHCQRSWPIQISETPRAWTCAKLEFRPSWMKLCSSDNRCTIIIFLFYTSIFKISYRPMFTKLPVAVCKVYKEHKLYANLNKRFSKYCELDYLSKKNSQIWKIWISGRNYFFKDIIN